MGDIGKVILVPRERIRPFPGQPRKYFNEEALRQLAESISRIGQQVPVSVRPISDDSAHDYELIDGQRRWHACDIAGKSEIMAWVKEATTDQEQFIASVVSNLGRADHTALEIAHALERMMKENDFTSEHVARICGRSTAWVYQHLSVLKLAPEVQQMMDPKIPEERQLRFSVAVELANLPEYMQRDLAATICDRKLPHFQARALIRQRSDEAKIESGDHPRRTRDDYRLFASFLNRMGRDGNMFLEMPASKFKDMFANRSHEDRENARDRIQGCVDTLTAFLNQLKDDGDR